MPFNARTRDAVGEFHRQLSVSHTSHLADQAACGDDCVALFDRFDHFAMLFLALLLRPDEQEIEIRSAART